MAKFTKLNIGDAVASSGGRVWKKLSAESEEVQDELAGVWTVNDTLLEYSDNIQINVDGFFTGIDESQNLIEVPLKSIYLKTNTSYERYSLLSYIGSSPTDYPMYITARRASGFNCGYRGVQGGTYVSLDSSDIRLNTFTITSKLSEVTNGDVLLTWLKANATKTA